MGVHPFTLEVCMNVRTHRPLAMRRQILLAAMDSFHRSGIDSTRTDEIIEAACVTKVEFHQHFKRQSDLVRVVLRIYFEELAAGIAPVTYELYSWNDVEQSLASHVKFQRKFGMKRGCPIGTLGSELKGVDELTRQPVSLIFDLMLARLESFFSREKVAGRLLGSADVEQLANFYVATVQGAMLSGKVNRNARCVETVFEDLLSHLRRYERTPAATTRRTDGSHNLGLKASVPNRGRFINVPKPSRGPDNPDSRKIGPVERAPSRHEIAVDGSNSEVGASEEGFDRVRDSSLSETACEDFPPAGSGTV